MHSTRKTRNDINTTAAAASKHHDVLDSGVCPGPLAAHPIHEVTEGYPVGPVDHVIHVNLALAQLRPEKRVGRQLFQEGGHLGVVFVVIQGGKGGVLVVTLQSAPLS